MRNVLSTDAPLTFLNVHVADGKISEASIMGATQDK